MKYDALLREKIFIWYSLKDMQSIHSSKYFTPQNNSHIPSAQGSEKLAGPILRREGSDDSSRTVTS